MHSLCHQCHNTAQEQLLQVRCMRSGAGTEFKAAPYSLSRRHPLSGHLLKESERGYQQRRMKAQERSNIESSSELWLRRVIIDLDDLVYMLSQLRDRMGHLRKPSLRLDCQASFGLPGDSDAVNVARSQHRMKDVT